jgi:hypothetical protein
MGKLHSITKHVYKIFTQFSSFVTQKDTYRFEYQKQPLFYENQCWIEHLFSRIWIHFFNTSMCNVIFTALIYPVLPLFSFLQPSWWSTPLPASVGSIPPSWLSNLIICESEWVALLLGKISRWLFSLLVSFAVYSFYYHYYYHHNFLYYLLRLYCFQCLVKHLYLFVSFWPAGIFHWFPS